MAKPEAPDKQAVLVIHGVGEQRPMATLRRLVRAVWTSADSVHHRFGVPTVWSKPDTISGSFELRRLTTGKNAGGVRTDFFELYWAHLMEGTSLWHVAAWARILLVRPPWRVPKALRGAWLLLALLTLIVAFFALQTMLAEPDRWLHLPAWATALAGLAMTAVAGPVLRLVVGDAARYLNAAPVNIQRRQEIRAKGVEILRKLHETGEYRRIVVVGHSLGSVIGYDILTYAWALYHQTRGARRPWKLAALDAAEGRAAAAKEGGAFDVEAWQGEQRALFAELRVAGNPWLVTDFVTAGSPLAHAAILLAADEGELRARQRDRELPTCPPVLEQDRFSFPPKAKRRFLHHAAVFGPTRWTNLYFPCRWLLAGDVIGGPVAPVFGPGVRDVPVRTERWGGLLSHTLYWTPESDAEVGSHIERLREALDLLDAGAPVAAEGGDPDGGDR